MNKYLEAEKALLTKKNKKEPVANNTLAAVAAIPKPNNNSNNHHIIPNVNKPPANYQVNNKAVNLINQQHQEINAFNNKSLPANNISDNNNFNNKSLRDVELNSNKNNYHDYINFANQMAYADQAANIKGYTHNSAVKTENNIEIKNYRDKSPINNNKSVTKAAGTAATIKNTGSGVMVHNHIADTIRSVSNSKKIGAATSSCSSVNKVYVRNKSKNDYETTKNNIFPNQKFSAAGNRHKSSKSKRRKQEAAAMNIAAFTHSTAADMKDYPNFNTEPSSHSSNIYNNYSNNNFTCNDNNNYHGKNNISHNTIDYDYAKINHQAAKRNADLNRLFTEEKANNKHNISNNNKNKSENALPRGRRVEAAKASVPFEIRNYTNSRSNSAAGYARKPSAEWRRGDDTLEPQRVHNNAYPCQNSNVNNSVNNEKYMRNVNNINEYPYQMIDYNPNQQFYNNQGKIIKTIFYLFILSLENLLTY